MERSDQKHNVDAKSSGIGLVIVPGKLDGVEDVNLFPQVPVGSLDPVKPPRIGIGGVGLGTKTPPEGLIGGPGVTPRG